MISKYESANEGYVWVWLPYTTTPIFVGLVF